MPKINLNPLTSGGKTDPVSDPLGTVWSAVIMVMSFGFFFLLAGYGQEVAAYMRGILNSFLGLAEDTGNDILGEI